MKKKTSDIEPYVTDHALLRYMERVMGIDVERVRKEIMTEERKAVIKSGCNSFTSNGFRYVLKNRAIITILKIDL